MLESRLAEQLLKQSTLHERGYRYEYARQGRGIAVRITGQGEQASMLLEWAFGAGVQAYTAVGREGDRWIEHRMSYYTGPSRLSLTPGHFAPAVLSAEDALGIPQEPSKIARCFGCHATRRGPALDGQALELGVRCERCHGPASDHIQAARSGNQARIRKTILNGGRFPAQASVMICGECHRTPPLDRMSAAPELDDPLSVRFQPVGLLASRCFQSSKGLSCLTCHDPHEDARREDAGFYTGRCLTCHRAEPGKFQRLCRRAARENCLPCHMLRTTPAPHLSFTDHRIRVY